MEIVHLGKYYWRKGGIESVTRSVCRAAAAEGLKVKCICFDNAIHQESDMGCRIVNCGETFSLASQPISMTYVFKAMRYIRSADVTHVHLPNYLAALAVLIAGRRRRILVHWHADVLGKGILRLILRPIERAVLRKAWRVVVTSPEYVLYSNSLRNVAACKIEVIPIGAPDLEGAQEEADRRRKRIKGTDVVRAVFVGRLVSYKGVEELIEKLNEIDLDVELKIIGSGPEFTKIRKKIEELKLSHRVYLLGRLDDAMVRSELANADFLILPSLNRSEAFGVVLLEAFRVGLPVVCSAIDGSGMKWVNKDGVTGKVFDPFDTEALRRAVSFFYERDLGGVHSACRMRYVGYFNEDVTNRRFLDLYADTIGMDSDGLV